MDKIFVSQEIVKKVLIEKPLPIDSTPEGAIVSKAFSYGIPPRKIRGGWVEYSEISQRWRVYKVITK